MAQAGIHSLVGVAMRRWLPNRKWLMMGVVLGNLLPDADNLAVAIATLTKQPTDGLHRTFTHSVFTVAAVVTVFCAYALITRRSCWGNLGVGLGIGISMHILLDLLIWFNGVETLWPFPSWINLWEGITMPKWWNNLMMPIEFLFFALFFALFYRMARKQGTDSDYLRTLKTWIWAQGVLFIVFTILVYVMEKIFMIPFGVLYLLSLGLATGVTIRMRKTIETTGATAS
jgi:membrane-bound metal-dependent hydrolase YbcI (DUF457 family)